MARPFRQLLLIVVLMSSVLSLGTFGYRFIEHQSYFDSFYMALISLAITSTGISATRDVFSRRSC